MDDAVSLEALKVRGVDGQQLRDAVNIHARGQSRIVDLHSLNFVRDEKPAPTVMHIAAVR